jgi:hypothetical protein
MYYKNGNMLKSHGLSEVKKKKLQQICYNFFKILDRKMLYYSIYFFFKSDFQIMSHHPVRCDTFFKIVNLIHD